MIGRLVTLLLFVSTAVAQSDSAAADKVPAPSMTFSAASIRPVKREPGQAMYIQLGGFQPSNSSHLTMTNWPLISVVKAAFSLQMYLYNVVSYDKRFSDVLQVMYTIQTPGDEDADKRLAALPRDQCKAEQQHMLQGLLIDRFQSKFHWEDRVMPGYRLVIAKRGSKLLPAGSLPIDAETRRTRGEDGKMAPFHQRRDDLGTVYVGRGASVSNLVPTLSNRMRSPVQDATGLDGEHDFDLRLLDADNTSPENSQEQVADALQDQLGLRLEATRITQKILVIDHIEAPSPN
jgi:uncharacterized protein (TIGR03435 family)